MASFIGLAAVTGSDIMIEARARRPLAVLPAFERLGVRVESDGDSIHVPPARSS